ncbi:MAG: hypothetical protein L0Y75_09380 [Acidobacteria bacterium]|nr:hypothetical protein [Acidobacteriota bacterium]
MISQLSHRERLWLIERLAHQLREESGSVRASQPLSADDQLSPAPSDTQVQAELGEDEAAEQEIVWPASAETPAERGARLLQLARQQQAQWAAGWAKAMEELGISGEPIGAEKVQEMFVACGVKPEDNEFSRGIIEMREE